MLHTHSVAVALLAAALAQAAPAQNVHRVGAGHFPSIQAAIDAAAPTDVVLVEAGVYPSFHVGKPLTITAEPSALVQVVDDDPVGIALQPMDRLHLAGLDVHVPAITIAGGMVSAERCTIATRRGVRVVAGTLLLRWSSVGALHGSGVLLQNANLHASDSTLTTAAGSSTAAECAAIEFQGSCLGFLSVCSVFGAWPGTASAPLPSPALLATGITAPAVRVWLRTCTLVGGFGPASTLGPAVVAPASPAPAAIRHHQCLTAGPMVGAIATGPVLGLRSSADLAIGGPFTTTMLGEAGHVFVFYFGSNVLGHFPIFEVEQPAMGFLDVVIFPAVVANALGEASFPVAIPNDPVLRHSTLWWRGVDVSVFPWQATPAFVTVTQ
ncbi:MAG: hypothetical protein WAT39_03535 [Planctomycetota bacterium]